MVGFVSIFFYYRTEESYVGTLNHLEYKGYKMELLDLIIKDSIVIVTEATNNAIKLPMVIDPKVLTIEIENYDVMLPSLEKAIKENKYVIIISPRIKELLTAFEYKLFLYVEGLVALAKPHADKEYDTKRIHYAALDIVIKMGYGRFYANALSKILNKGALENSLTVDESFYLAKFIQAVTSISKRHSDLPNLLKIVPLVPRQWSIG